MEEASHLRASLDDGWAVCFLVAASICSVWERVKGKMVLDQSRAWNGRPACKPRSGRAETHPRGDLTSLIQAAKQFHPSMAVCYALCPS